MSRFLTFSLLVPFHYCKYQVYLQEYLGIRGQLTRDIIRGTARHALLEQEFLQEAEETEVPLPELVGRVLEGLEPPFVTREVPLVSQSLMLRGRADELEVHANQAIVVDDKPRLSRGGKSQVLAYAIAFKEQFLFPGPILAMVRHRDTAEELWKQALDKKVVKQLKKEVRELHAIAEGKEPEPCREPLKCARCRFRQACPAAKQ